MRKERRDLEEWAMKANEMIAASHQLRPILSKAIRSHVDELTEDLVKIWKSMAMSINEWYLQNASLVLSQGISKPFLMRTRSSRKSREQ